MRTYKAKNDYTALNNSIIDIINLSDLIDLNKTNLKNAWINVGGWQSWNPGFEVEPGKKQKSLTCHIIKGWNKYLTFPESNFKSSKNLILGQFITYLRWDNNYLVFASVGNKNHALPPVQFIFNKKNNTVALEIYDKGSNWKKNDLQAEIEIFTADSYFDCKRRIQEILNNEAFSKLEILGNNPCGWESWYNHYSNINDKLILENLHSLSTTNNLISSGNFSSKIFQIDDGWEQALGDWTYRSDRFPNGLSNIVTEIENNEYIPGLWIAPFIIDARSKTAMEHPEWILCDSNNKKIVCGYNPLWGEKGNFYCLDLSNEDVIVHLDSVMNCIINDWGFRYIKLDFLYAGMIYGKYKNNTPAYKNYINALNILTKRKSNSNNKPVFYLGCGVPFESSFKFLPLSRIGCDTYEHWENKTLRLINWNGRNEAYLNVKDTLGHSLWNKTVFYNDPDVLFIRENNCSLSTNEKKLITFTNTIFGSQIMYSDDPCIKATENEMNLTKEIIELINKFQNQNFGEKQIANDVYEVFNEDYESVAVLDLKKRTILFIGDK